MTPKFKVLFSAIIFLLVGSMILNVGLLKSANKFNLDSLKWTLKSQFLKYKEIQNGKIPLITNPSGGIDYSRFLDSQNNDAQTYLIKNIGSNFSIFGLGKGAGFSGLPKGLPGDVAKCAVKRGLDKNLYFADQGSYGLRTAFVFYQSDLQTNSLIGSLVLQGNCSSNKKFKIQKSVTSWLLSNKIDSNLKPEQLPARLTLNSKGSKVVVTRLGEICVYEKIVSDTADLNCRKSSLDFSKAKKNTHFGVKSILLDGSILYIAYATNDLSCERMEIKRLQLSNDFSKEESSALIYKSPGCFNPDTTELNAVGGRMIFTNEGKTKITFSLGNAEIWTGLEKITSNPDYGNILTLDLSTNSVESISSGHRNPQGLCYVDGELYSSEQGPDGGDEFNLIEKGNNYGWPRVSFGMPYGEFVSGTVKNRSFMSHDGYRKPLLSWVPAIAAGDLICPKNQIRGAWSKDFLLATLKDSSLRRLVLSEGAIRVDERIPLGYRIRDISISRQGEIAAMTDEGSVIQIKLIDR